MWNPFFRPCLAVFLLSTFLVLPGVALDEPSNLDEDLENRVEALRRQIEDLLSQVPEALRQEVRRRLLRTEVQTTSPDAIVHSDSADPSVAESVSVASSLSAPALSESTPVVPSAAGVAEAEPAAVEPAAAEPAAAEPKTAAATTPVPETTRPWRRRRCNTLDLFDENADGRITALDRDWRYLYLWVDENRDGRAEVGEFESAYTLGVREIALHLETFVRKKKGGIGEIRRQETLLFDLRGNGFETGQRPDDGALAIDATALSRGGGPQIFSAEGKKIEGIQPFRKGWKAHTEEAVVEFTCP